jgi:2-phospho-L-lactate transferase/gluconeogenesis factor (CofD/UPF0052 family)
MLLPGYEMKVASELGRRSTGNLAVAAILQRQIVLVNAVDMTANVTGNSGHVHIFVPTKPN